MTRGMFVEMSVVYYPPRASICLRSDVHARTPSVWGIEGDSLQDTKTDISLQTLFSGAPSDKNLWPDWFRSDCLRLGMTKARSRSRLWVSLLCVQAKSI